MGIGSAAIVTLTVPVSDVAPGTPDVSAPTVSVHVPEDIAVTVNADADCCQPGGADEQVAFAVCALTGIDAGVPGATAFGFVSVAWALNEPDAPMFRVDGAPVIVTWYCAPEPGGGAGAQPPGIGV